MKERTGNRIFQGKFTISRKETHPAIEKDLKNFVEITEADLRNEKWKDLPFDIGILENSNTNSILEDHVLKRPENFTIKSFV